MKIKELDGGGIPGTPHWTRNWCIWFIHDFNGFIALKVFKNYNITILLTGIKYEITKTPVVSMFYSNRDI